MWGSVQVKKGGHFDGGGQRGGTLCSHSIVPQVQVGDGAVKLQKRGELLHHLAVAQGAVSGRKKKGHRGDGSTVSLRPMVFHSRFRLVMLWFSCRTHWEGGIGRVGVPAAP